MNGSLALDPGARRRIDVVNKFEMSPLIVLAIESLFTDSTSELRFLEMHCTLVGQQIGTKAEGIPTLLTFERALAVVHSAHVSLEMSFRLKLEPTYLTCVVANLIVDYLLHTPNMFRTASGQVVSRRERQEMFALDASHDCSNRLT